MFRYAIRVQFANPNGPEFPDVIEVIQAGIDYYNQKSLIATNPKSIVEYKVLDPHTLELVLESGVELPYPGKGLQTFSRYLVDSETEGSLNQYIYGKQLFKMTSEELIVCDTQKVLSNNSLDLIKLEVISRILIASEKELDEINCLLKKERAK